MLRRALLRFLTTTESLESRVALEQATVVQRLKEEQDREAQKAKLEAEDGPSPLGEYGFRPRGPEPTRFGDWERKGRVSDF